MPWSGEIDVPAETANALWRLLKNRCRGEEHAVPKPRLRQWLAAAGFPTPARTMDAAVTLLRNLPRYPICTSGKGVFWAIRRDELERADRYIVSRFDDLRAGHAAYQAKLRHWDAPGRATPQPPAREYKQRTLALGAPAKGGAP